MQSGDRSHANYGTLEKWTVALFALSLLLSVLTLVPAIICMAFSRFWTATEKSVAVLIPMLAAIVFGPVFGAVFGVQEWILYPMLLTFIGFAGCASGAFLFARGRAERTGLVNTA